MAHPYASQAKSGSASKMKSIAGKKSGGSVFAGGTQSKPAYAKGGKVEEFKVGGTVSAPSFARGGRSKSKGKHKGTHINIAVVAPHGKGAPDDAAAMPPGLPPGGPPMAPPPGMGPGMPPPGGPPPGMPPMKRGGAAYAKGGKVPMTAGGESGKGRLQKIKAYGLSPKKAG